MGKAQRAHAELNQSEWRIIERFRRSQFRLGFFEDALNRVCVARGANGPGPYIFQILKPRGHAALCPPYRSLEVIPALRSVYEANLHRLSAPLEK